MLAPLVLLLCAGLALLIPWSQQDSDSATVAQPAPPSTSVRPAPTPNTSAPTTAAPDQDASPAPADQPDDDADQKPGQQSAEQKEAYDLPVDESEVKGVSSEKGPYEGLGRVVIRKLKLDVVLGEGVLAETLDRGPGHWPGTPMPGQEGNSVISGYRTTKTQPFEKLDALRPGNTIVVTLEDGEPTTFVVDSTTIVPESEYRAFVLREPEDRGTRQLTIFACHPMGDPVNRIVVRATADSD